MTLQRALALQFLTQYNGFKDLVFSLLKMIVAVLDEMRCFSFMGIEVVWYMPNLLLLKLYICLRMVYYTLYSTGCCFK